MKTMLHVLLTKLFIIVSNKHITAGVTLVLAILVHYAVVLYSCNSSVYKHI